MVKSAVKALAVGIVAAVIGVVVGRQLAPTPKPILSEPLARLQYGNELFAKGTLVPPKADEMTRYKLQTEGQHPFAVVVTCADSRTPPEFLFNQGLGDLFVVRTAGIVISDEVLASIEYAVAYLKVPLIVVLGHTECDLLQHALSAKPLEGHLPLLTKHFEPVIRQVRSTHPHLKGEARLSRVTQEHVREAIRTIYQRSAIVRKHHQLGKVAFAAGVYHLREGKVEWLKLPEEWTDK